MRTADFFRCVLAVLFCFDQHFYTADGLRLVGYYVNDVRHAFCNFYNRTPPDSYRAVEFFLLGTHIAWRHASSHWVKAFDSFLHRMWGVFKAHKINFRNTYAKRHSMVTVGYPPRRGINLINPCHSSFFSMCCRVCRVRPVMLSILESSFTVFEPVSPT